MNFRHFFLGVATGIVGTYLFQQVAPKQTISSEQALRIVKQEIKKHSPITGSWIQMKPETLIRNNISYKVYRGGITKLTGNVQEQMEFIIDTEGGTILDLQPLEQ